MRMTLLLCCLVLAIPGRLLAQAPDRQTKVLNDRQAFAGSTDWVYNDLERARQVARENGKPLLVVMRCIPCEACQEFDDSVASRDPKVRDLMEQYVCVRIPMANQLDLTHFQFDFDQSFAIFLMNPDLTIYARYATRSDRREAEDISLEGLRKTLEAALRIHRNVAIYRPTLAGKQVTSTRYRTPLEYPSLAGRYQITLDYEGQVVHSCVHCHQVREAERLVYRTGKQPIPDEVLFPYPDPSVLGLTMDPKELATIKQVAPESIAGRAGLKPGDAITTLMAQPILSTADIQWVLHNTAASAELVVDIIREDRPQRVRLKLPDGWRRGNIAWRTTTWDLRRMGLGGMRLDDLTDEERKAAKLDDQSLALRIRHLGAAGAGNHGVAKRAGLEKGDVIVSFDKKDQRMTESELIAYSVQAKQPGDEISVTVLRDGERKTFQFAMQ
jgi:serine protease Do